MYFGISNHSTNSNTLAPVLFNSCEDYLSDNIYETHLKTFLYKDIYKKIGLSFNDFLNLPRYKIDKIVNIMNEFDKNKINIDTNILNKLENSL